jgi:hypothetical protein
MPLLGEVRGDPGKSWSETVSNWNTAYLETLRQIEERFPTYSLKFAPSIVVGNAMFKEASKQMDLNEKAKSMDLVKNIRGISITDFTDQVVEGKKIVGSRLSCGLHIHFSYGAVATKTVDARHFEKCDIPLQTGIGDKPLNVELYKKVSEKTTEVLRVEVSKFTRPAVHFLVDEMDKAFFERFAPPEEERTKYRHPGFYETKSYGFEYRSLPASEDTMSNLADITKHSFDILNQLDKF